MAHDVRMSGRGRGARALVAGLLAASLLAGCGASGAGSSGGLPGAPGSVASQGAGVAGGTPVAAPAATPAASPPPSATPIPDPSPSPGSTVAASPGPTAPAPARTASPAASRAASPPPSAATPAARSLPAWRGGIDLYRAGVFTTQRTWLWCTAAAIQIARNIVYRSADHTTAFQGASFAWMRARNRYRLPLSGGVDAQGWAAGFRHYVNPGYRLHAETSFAAALRSAVTRLRLTGLPVGITVDRGNHAWLITGFTATADPAATARFTVTSVRVVGPLWGLQSRNGYDMPPDTRLTPAQLSRFFTPWRYAPLPMVWDGTYISVQP